MRKNLETILFEKDLKRREVPKNDAEAVTRYLLYGDIKLNNAQKELSERLLFVDQHLRERKLNHDEIITLTMKVFNVSNYRAQRDINDCQKVFGETRKLNKTYLLSHHIQEIGMQIQKCLDAKKYEYLPKLNDNLTYALNSLPVETDLKEAVPAKIVFVFNGAAPTKNESLDDVLAEADAILHKNTANGSDYIEFEEAGGTDDNTGAELSTDDGSDDPGE